jgi:hypothetical protein
LKSVLPSDKKEDAKTIGDLLFLELENMEKVVKEEKERFMKDTLTEKEKGKRLLFLFQKDLMPGINGLILESKEKRDEIIQKSVSLSMKILGWCFIACITIGMLFYILLFALSQDSHRQRAWGQSFALWLVVEILIVSSLSVLVMNILIPSLIMKDVGVIKKKLVTTVITFYQEMAQERLIHQKNGFNGLNDNEEEEFGSGRRKGIFNSAEYLFVSNRLATIYSDLKLAKMVLSFQTPWPKQSYQHVTDVSKKYNRKFSTVQRSISIIVLFFLSGLLSVPLSIQDMIVQLTSTVAMGYTVLFHVRLYQIFPVLIAVPTFFLGAILHFVIRAYQSKKKMAETKLLNEMTDMKEKSVEFKVMTTRNPNKKNEDSPQAPQHKRRRQSFQQGITLAKRLNEFIEQRTIEDYEKEVGSVDGMSSFDSSLNENDEEEDNDDDEKGEVTNAYKIFQNIAKDFEELDDDDEDQEEDQDGLFNLHLASKPSPVHKKNPSNKPKSEETVLYERKVPDNEEEEKEDDDNDSLEQELCEIRKTVVIKNHGDNEGEKENDRTDLSFIHLSTDIDNRGTPPRSFSSSNSDHNEKENDQEDEDKEEQDFVFIEENKKESSESNEDENEDKESRSSSHHEEDEEDDNNNVHQHSRSSSQHEGTGSGEIESEMSFSTDDDETLD